jgi:hypothetical protein
VRVGIVDLDTSHPQNWIPIERELGCEIVGVWDGGAVHPAGYAEKFAQEREIPRVFSTVEEMVSEVDCAIIHSCDWDTHIAKARPFIEAGKAVLIDKPMAGNLRDLRQIYEWARQGARITGGSSLRFCFENQEWLAKPVSERGTPDTVLCGCGVDEFNYGIHAYSMLAGIMGGGAKSVRHLGKGVQRRVQVSWADGRMGFIVVGAADQWIPFYASISTERSTARYQADNGRLYRALLETTLPYLKGETDQPPVPPDELIEPELWALAARKSWMEGDREVALDELSEAGSTGSTSSPQASSGQASSLQADGGYNGAAFAAEYRKQKYPEKT